MKACAWFLYTFLVLGVLWFVGIRLDLYFNESWLLPALHGWRWWNFFTNVHGTTMLYLLGGWRWLVTPFVLAAIVTAFAHDRKP